jgi:ATP-dependent DNA helicase RecG
MKKLRALDPRVMMERAIAVMRESIPEPRRDGKTSPKVGAVLVKPDGTIESAYRGELRHGDHAEFTLLERKNRGNRLDGSVLFATLEPCAPGARRDPKVDCAERIRLARIKEVWIGIQDPDPTVARKGIQYLEENGITVRMFDRDLQEVIEQENTDFLKQANERAAKARRKCIGIPLS